MPGGRSLIQGENQGKFCSFSRCAFHSDAASHLFHKLMDNGKAQPAALLGPALITLIQPLKNMLQISLPDPPAIVRHQKLHGSSLF